MSLTKHPQTKNTPIIGSTKVDVIGQNVHLNPGGGGGLLGGDTEQFMACNADEQKGCEWLGSDDDSFGLSQEQLDKHPNLTKRLQNEERFLGEKTAMKYLIEADNDAELAWENIRAHRNTYKGLREADRNAEHYLYALSKVRDNSYNWSVMHVATAGYGLYKGTANVFGTLDEMQTGKNPSPFKGSPVTINEFLAGHLGAQDGLYGIRE